MIGGCESLREGADDLDARLGMRVGLVDDAERRFAGRHQLQCRAHVFGLRDLAFDRRPDAERFERGLAVFAGRAPP
jgi:hypothetical protein